MLKVARCFALLALMSAFLTLAGYGRQIHVFTGLNPQLQGMSVSTAIILVLLSTSVLAATAAWERLRALTGGLALTASVPILLSHLVTGRDAISPAVAQSVFGIVGGLEHLGFEVQAAMDGTTGLASLQAREPDVVVIDFLMPGMNGAALAKAAQALYPKLPIVFVSGYSDTLALNGIANAVVLRKPFKIEDLHRAVRAVLDHDEEAMSTFGELA